MTNGQLHGALLNEVYDRIVTGPGRTELELTRAIYGEDVMFSKVNQQIRRLVKDGSIHRKGEGNKREPYRYYPTTED